MYTAGYDGVPVLVLGASGFVGRWVARHLCRGGARVTLAARDRAAAEAIFSAYGIGGEIAVVDLLRKGAAGELLRAVRPAITFNLAGYGVDRAEQEAATAYAINGALVDEICRGVAETADPAWSGQALVHAGTVAEYGDVGGYISEEVPPRPATPYGKSKLAGTEALARSGVRGLTARLFTVYGPGEHTGRLVPSLLEAARTTQPLALTEGLQKRDFTYVEDVAEGLLRLGLASAAPGMVVNLGTGTLTTVRQFAETAAPVLGIPGEVLRFGAVAARADEMEHVCVRIERLRALTGWTPPTAIAEGIRRTAAFRV